MIDSGSGVWARLRGASRAAASAWRRVARRLRPRTPAQRRIALGMALVAAVAVLLVGGVYVRLLFGPISLSYLDQRVTAAVQKRLPGGLSIRVSDTVLERDPGTGNLYLSMLDVELRQGEGVKVFTAPRAAVGLSVGGLLTGRMIPRGVWLVEPAITLIDDGSGLRLQSMSAVPQDPLETLSIVLTLLTDDTGISSLGIRDARITVVRDNKDPALLEHVTVGAFRGRAPQSITLNASLGEEAGSPRLTGDIAQQEGGDILVSLAVDNLAIPNLAPLLPEDIVSLFTSPLSTVMSLRLAADGEIEVADGHISVGAGHIGFGENRLVVDKADFSFDWSDATRRLTIHPSTILAGHSHGTLSGQIVVPERGEFNYGSVPVHLELADVEIGDPQGRRPAVYPSVLLEAIYVARQGILHVSRLDIAAEEAAASLVGFVGGGRGETPGVRLAGSALPMPINALKDLWPPFIGRGTRRWVIEHFEGGRISDARLSVDIRPGALAALARGVPLPESSYTLEFGVADATFSYLGELPPISGAEGRATLTPSTFDLRTSPGASIDLETGERIAVGAGRFFIPDRRVEPGTGYVSLEASGTTSAILKLLDHDPLEVARRRDLDPDTIGGEGDFDVALVIPLMKELRMSDIGLTVNGVIEGFSAHDFAGARTVEDGKVELSVDGGRISVTGEALVDGLPAEIAFEDTLGGSGANAGKSVTMRLDDAARESLGIPLGDVITGPVTVTVSDLQATPDGSSQQVRADLSAARIDFSALGLEKPAGEEATASFRVFRNVGSTKLSEVDFRSGAIRVEGEAEFNSEGRLVSLNLPVVRTARGTDMAVTGTARDGGESYSLRGTAIDLRPVLRNLNRPGASEAAGSETTEGPDKRIDIEVSSAIGFNGESLENFTATVEQMDGRTARIEISGTTGGGRPVSVRYSDDGTNADVAMESGNGGRLLSWTGLYGNMRGGQLRLAAARRGAEAAMAGRLVIDGFAIADDPSLSRLIERGRQSTAGRRADVSRPDTSRGGVNASNVGFDTLSVPFQRTASAITLGDGVLRGPAVGATIEGTIDLAGDRLALSGTYVPLYELNNLFGQLPLFGPLLGGKRNEGLFGITYSVSGPIDQPVLTINPLSAVAPGVFRYILGMDNPRAAQPRSNPARDDPSLIR